MQSLKEMENTIKNLDVDTIKDGIKSITIDASLTIKHELFTLNANLSELISYMRTKVKSLGHCRVSIDSSFRRKILVF